MTTIVETSNLTQTFGDHTVLDQVDLSIEKGQFVTIYVTHTPRIFVAERKADQRRVVAERRAEKRRVVAERKRQIKRRNIVRKPTKVAERQRNNHRDLHYSVQTRDKRLIDVAQQ